MHIEENGKLRLYYAGDFVEVGKHDARNWLATGQCEILNIVAKRDIIPPDAGIVLRGNIQFEYDGLEIVTGGLEVKFEKTLIWSPDFPLNKNMIPIGLHLLDRWEIAVPITDYNLLARDIGTDEEQQQTQAIIHEMRVPVYDTRLVFARQCTATEELFKLWRAEKGDERLAFLRVLYQVKPYILALPSIWKA